MSNFRGHSPFISKNLENPEKNKLNLFLFEKGGLFICFLKLVFSFHYPVFSAHGFWGSSSSNSSSPQDDLRTAIKSNDLEGIRKALEDGARVNYRYADDHSARPVHYVQSAETIDLLANAGSNDKCSR